MTDTPAAYLRTSLEDFNRAHGLADQSQSISNQRKVILEYVQHNPEFSEVQIREFIDDGLTGTNTDRPQFQAMIEAARRGEVKCIIVKDLSRFGRNYLDVGDYLEHIFPFLGVRVIAVNDGYDSKQYEGKTGGMDIAFRNFMYENYSRDLSIKVRSAMHSRMKKGRFVNHVPYGYQKAPGDKHLMVPDPNTAPIVREIFQSIIRGKSTSQIAKELNTRGVLTPLAYKQHRLKPACQNRELMWSHITVLNILKNDKYTGVMTNHTRESRYMPACDTVFYCGHCGRKLRKSHGLDTYFACDTQLYQENATCSNIRWSKTDLEAVMLPVYKAQLYLLGERAKELALQGDGHPNENWPEMVGKIDREIAACQAQKVQYYEAYRNGDLDRGAFVEQKAALAIRIEHLQGERTEIELKRQAQRTQIEARESAKRELSQYLYATHLDGALLTESMYQAIDRVKVFSNERIEIRWKFEDLFAGQGYRERKAV